MLEVVLLCSLSREETGLSRGSVWPLGGKKSMDGVVHALDKPRNCVIVISQGLNQEQECFSCVIESWNGSCVHVAY